MRWSARYDEAVAFYRDIVGLYQELLDAEGLTPLLRSEAHAAISDLRAGLPVREPWADK